MSVDKWKNLNEFITQHRVEKGCEYTHTNLSYTPFSFYIPYESLDVFYTLYEKSFEKGLNLYITEKNRHFGPIVIDFDLQFRCGEEQDINERIYTKSTVKKVCQIYGNAIRKFFDLPEKDCKIFVMEKTKPYPHKVKNIQKDGIHFIIPSISTKPSVKRMIRNQVLQEIGALMKEIGAINKIEEIIDEAVIEKNSWYMYGSKKKQNEPYLLTKIYSFDGQLLEADIPCSEKIKMFSIRNKMKETIVRSEMIQTVEEFENKEDEERRKIKANKKILSSLNNNKATHYDNIELVKKLVHILNPSRANSYEDWIRLGWCLRNIDIRLDSTWEEFSKKSPKYVTGQCSKFWNRMKDGGLEIGTLHMWAKQDNQTAYCNIMKTDLGAIIYESKSKAHHDVARVVHHMFQHQYVCSSAKGRFWYEYKNHRWHVSESGITLRQKYSDEVWKIYHQEAIVYNHKAIQASNAGDQANFSETAKTFNDIAMKLRNTNFKENIMKECAELFYIDKFEDKLDANTNLIGFENGVYDLEEHAFRDGKPEDYISFSTGVNYIPYDEKNPTVASINEYLQQVLTNTSVRDYVMKLFATFINGNIKEQKFYIWTGSGSNSKSKLVELFEKSFGDYCCKVPIALLTQKRIASNAANGELARAKGKRFACLQEPSEDEKINIGLMKELSGGDKVLARAIYKEPFEFFPQFKMLLLCNHLPYVPSDDGGTWRRIRVVEFTSKFVEYPVEPNEFPIDYDLSEKMEGWKEHFIAMIIQYYKLYELEGITEPSEVMKCTTDYKSQNDHMSAFINSKLEKKEGMFLTLDEAHTELRGWIKDDCIPIKLPSKPDLERYLSKTLGKLVMSGRAKGYKGYRIKPFVEPNNEEEEGEEHEHEREHEVKSEDEEED